MNPNRSLGPMTSQPCFIKNLDNILFGISRDNQRLIYAYVILLSKKEGTSLVSDYKPGSLNVVYKIRLLLRPSP